MPELRRRAAIAAVLLLATSCSRLTSVGDSGIDAGARDGGSDAGVDAGARDAGPCERILHVEATPTKRAQMAVWLEGPDGRFETVALTGAVAQFGLGNRPGAQQHHTGWRWPMGRRLDVLPRWAHRRLERGGAPFRTVVWSDGNEGFAAGHPAASWQDPYYCMSFSPEAIEELDAVTCASLWSAEPGRYLTEDDVAAGYGAPFDPPDGEPRVRPLAMDAPYPPRRDLRDGLAAAHPDTGRFAADALAAMPSLDAVTMATPAADAPVEWTRSIPEGWPLDGVEVWLEVNTERDFNDAFPPTPVPMLPEGAWDHWAASYGIETGGQPSVVFRVRPGVAGQETTSEPVGRTERFAGDGALVPPADITDDPDAHPGSGADRLRLTDGARLSARYVCAD